MPDAEKGAGWRKPLWMRWWEFKCWFHRCPECGHRPDKHHDSTGPRWEDDKIAQMLGVAEYGCPRCGFGATKERDAVTCRCGHGEHVHDREASPPLCMLCGDDLGCVTPPGVDQ